MTKNHPFLGDKAYTKKSKNNCWNSFTFPTISASKFLIAMVAPSKFHFFVNAFYNLIIKGYWYKSRAFYKLLFRMQNNAYYVKILCLKNSKMVVGLKRQSLRLIMVCKESFPFLFESNGKIL